MRWSIQRLTLKLPNEDNSAKVIVEADSPRQAMCRLMSLVDYPHEVKDNWPTLTSNPNRFLFATADHINWRVIKED
jgi:hypothetical protein